MKKAAILRGWIVFVGCLTLLVSCPEVAIIPIAFMFPGCLCCGGGSCSVCNDGASASSIQVTFGGTGTGTNGSSGLPCGNYNSTYVITAAACGGTACTSVGPCCYVYGSPQITVEFTATTVNVQVPCSAAFDYSFVLAKSNPGTCLGSIPEFSGFCYTGAETCDIS